MNKIESEVMNNTFSQEEKQAHLQHLIEVWESYGNTEEELLIEDLELDIQIETVEHMLKMKGVSF